MNLMIELTVAFLLAAMVFMSFHLRRIDKELDEKEQEIRGIRFEVEQLKAKQKVTEKRFQKMVEPKDKLEIVHTYDDSDAPKFGKF